MNSITREQISDIISSYGSKTHIIFGQDRRVGKSITGLVLAMHHAVSAGDFRSLIICPNNIRCRFKLDAAVELLKIMNINYSVKGLVILLDNNSQISFSNGVPRGVDIDLLFYDDFEFIESLAIPRNARYVYLSNSLYQLVVL